ncbi:Hypothetical protein CINCED_3A016817 [Cinara cedri]|uniref:Uncharacterized protein n=1 Tax=Cinara cedri TaxID=506608 RepID=A0A5E4M4G3_9HEMI|nr:Hypothetical protein CINCED_3A016817 [Cinara cedri]
MILLAVLAKQKSNQEEQINYSEECIENEENTIIESKLSGDILGKIVINILKHLNLNLKHYVGIATDGCSVMTSTVRSAVKYIQSNLQEINNITEIVDKEYSFILIEKQWFSSELKLWIAKWIRVKNEGYLPTTVIDGLDHCQDILFPSIKVLLLIIGYLPISVSSVERSLSTLRRLTDWLRSQMSQDRFNGLTLLHVHKEK